MGRVQIGNNDGSTFIGTPKNPIPKKDKQFNQGAVMECENSCCIMNDPRAPHSCKRTKYAKTVRECPAKMAYESLVQNK